MAELSKIDEKLRDRSAAWLQFQLDWKVWRCSLCDQPFEPFSDPHGALMLRAKKRQLKLWSNGMLQVFENISWLGEG